MFTRIMKDIYNGYIKNKRFVSKKKKKKKYIYIYISSGPHGFREEDFLSFSNYKSMGANDPQDAANLDPSGMVGRINVGDHLTSLHS